MQSFDLKCFVVISVLSVLVFDNSGYPYYLELLRPQTNSNFDNSN